MARGQHRFGDAPHVALVLHAVANQVGHGQQLHIVQTTKFHQLGNPRHRAVVIHHFADHARMVESGKPRQIHRRFGLPGADQHAAIARAQGVDVAGARQIFRTRIGIGGRQNSGGAVAGAGSSGGAAARINRFAERGAEHRRIARSDRRQAQRVAALLGHRQANQPAAEFGHEVDRFRRNFFGGDGQVAFVFAVFVVHQDDHAPGANFFQSFFHGGKRRFTVSHRISPAAKWLCLLEYSEYNIERRLDEREGGSDAASLTST